MFLFMKNFFGKLWNKKECSYTPADNCTHNFKSIIGGLIQDIRKKWIYFIMSYLIVTAVFLLSFAIFRKSDFFQGALFGNMARIVIIQLFIYHAMWYICLSYKFLHRFIFWCIFPIAVLFCEMINYNMKTHLMIRADFEKILLTTCCLGVIDFSINMILAKYRLQKSAAFFSALFHTIVLIPILSIIARLCFENSPTDCETFIAILQTDFREAFHYTREHTYVAISLLIPLLLTLGLFFIYKKCTRFPQTSAGLIVFIVAFTLIFNSGVLYSKNTVTSKSRTYLEYEVFFTVQYHNVWKKFAAATQQRKTNPVNESEKYNIKTKGNDGRFVLILGESFGRERFSCYGYAEKTTPFLDSVKNNPDFTFFAEAYSNHTHTHQALGLALTSCNQYTGNSLSLESSCSILNVLQHNNYRISVISNQSKYTPGSASNTVIFSVADDLQYFAGSLFTTFTDMKLVEEWKKQEKSERHFTILHMQGAHSPYENKYPADFQSGMNNSYDKALHYSDYVLQTFFADVIGNNSADVVIFVSDHGEDMKYQHDSANATVSMIKIPLIVYISPAYAKANPELAAMLKQQKDKIFTNDLLFELVLDIMGIKTTFSPPSLHILSPEYEINARNAKTLHGRRRIDMSIISGAKNIGH